MAQEDSTEKSHEPTQQKLETARRRGEVPQSQDVTTAAATAGFVLALLIAGGTTLRQLGQTGAILIEDADRIAAVMATGAQAAVAGVMISVVVAIAPFFGLPLLCALIAILAQKAFVVAPEKLAPKLSRISPLQGAVSKFGAAGLFTFAKSFFKLVAVSAVLAVFLSLRLEHIIALSALDPGSTVIFLGRLMIEFLALVLVLQGVVGMADMLWQRYDHLKKNRMSRQELIEEMKNTDGDPHLKAERRQRAVTLATNKMLADVTNADVVIVNPTHFAVALRWDRASGQAPICVAKGVDEIAARIRERAAKADIPIRHDPPSARALHASVEIGRQIQPEHYRSVAAAIRFAEAARKRARAQGKPK